MAVPTLTLPLPLRLRLTPTQVGRFDMTVLMLDRSARACLGRMFDALQGLLDAHAPADAPRRQRMAKLRATSVG